MRRPAVTWIACNWVAWTKVASGEVQDLANRGNPMAAKCNTQCRPLKSGALQRAGGDGFGGLDRVGKLLAPRMGLLGGAFKCRTTDKEAMQGFVTAQGVQTLQ